MDEDLIKGLRAIAEGYPLRVEFDRYIIVENPDFQPDNGSDPFITIDINNVRNNQRPPGWPDCLESAQAEAVRSGKLDFLEIHDLFDKMERELQLHRQRASQTNRKWKCRCGEGYVCQICDPLDCYGR